MIKTEAPSGPFAQGTAPVQTITPINPAHLRKLATLLLEVSKSEVNFTPEEQEEIQDSLKHIDTHIKYINGLTKLKHEKA